MWCVLVKKLKGVCLLHLEIVAQRVNFSTSFGPRNASKEITLLGSFDTKDHHTKNYKRRYTMDRSGSAVWHGSLKEGNGTISTQSGTLKETQYSFKARFADGV